MALQNTPPIFGAATGTGTSGTIAKWTGTTALGNSILSEVSSTITLTGGVTAANTSYYSTASINDFLQYDIKNTSTGTSAQTTYSLTADNGTLTTGFMSININNSTFTAVNAYSIGVANDCSVLASGNDLYVANASTTKDIIFSLGKVASPFFDEFMRISRSLLQTVFTGTNGIRCIAAATQDAMVIKGRAGGTTNLTATILPGNLTASRTLTTPDATGTIALAATTLAGYGITDGQPLDGDLTAIAALTGNGIAVQTAANTWALRTMTASAGVTVANGGGVAGAPAFSLSGAYTAAGLTLSTARLIGRTTASTGAAEEIAAGFGLSLSSLSLAVSSTMGVLDWNNQISVTTTATATIGRVHLCTGTTANYALTLPTAVGVSGQAIAVIIGSGMTRLLTVTGNGAELIDSVNTRIMWAGETAILVSNGVGWIKIGGKSVPMSAALKRTTAQSIANNTWTQVATTTSIYDNTSGLAAPCADTTNGRFAVRRPGRYQVSGYSNLASLASGIVVYIGVSKSSATPADNPNAYIYLNFPGDNHGTASAVFDCVAGDWLGAICFHNDSVARNTLATATVIPTVAVTEIPSW